MIAVESVVMEKMKILETRIRTNSAEHERNCADVDEGEDMTTISIDDDGCQKDPFMNLEVVSINQVQTPIMDMKFETK